MDTDALIAMLARGAGPVSPGAAGRRFAIALAAGGAAATALMIATLGLRPDLTEALRDPMFWVKFGTPALILACALALCMRAGQPGARMAGAAAALLLPVGAIWLLALLALASAPAGTRTAMILGGSWSGCVASVSMLAIPAFIAALWAMKGLAPTRPALAGAVAGLLAGSAGALVYTLHCPEMAAPFIATWYLIGIALPAVLGALVGPFLLRW